ncbi:MAG: AraC family transcriptional regulator, partial [Burkholderia gladioli]
TSLFVTLGTMENATADAAVTSFSTIKDALRYETACAALADSALTVADVATAAGFAEPSAFYRAFRGWSGLSPAAYREHELAARANRPG